MMNKTQGIALDTWADVDGDCSMSYCEVTRSNVQIVLGHTAGAVHLVMSESGLAALVDIANKALAELRAVAS